MSTHAGFNPEPVIVSPLNKLLMDSSLEELLLFLHRMKLQYTILRENEGTYRARIYGEGMLRYETSNPNSAKAAMCSAIARFLTKEQKDYHNYLEDKNLESKTD